MVPKGRPLFKLAPPRDSARRLRQNAALEKSMSNAPWSPELLARLTRVGERGGVLQLSREPEAAWIDTIRGLASDANLLFLEVDAGVAGLGSGGVARAAAADYLGASGPALADADFCESAVGDGRGAREALTSLRETWTGELGGGLPTWPQERPWLRHAEVLRRVLAEAGDVEARLLLLRNAGECDGPSLAALGGLMADGGAGWVVALAPAGDASGFCEGVARAADDERIAAAWHDAVELPEDEGDSPSLPRQGTAVELLDVLASAGSAVPAAVVGSDSLSRYRGRAPRAGWVDLQGVLDSGRATLSGDFVIVGPWTPTVDSPVVSADARALAAAVAEVLPEDSPGRALLLARLGAGDAKEAAAVALGRGELGRAQALLSSGAPVLRARTLRLAGDAAAAREIATGGSDALHLEGGLAARAAGRPKAARKHLEAVGGGREYVAARLVLGELDEEAGEFVAATKHLAEAAREAEQRGDSGEAARAFARRALAMSKAGAAERAIKELKLAMARASDPDDPSDPALEVRVLIGLVFREAGSRDKARQALAMAADKAHSAASRTREAEARLMLARFHLEGLPATGRERGEALRDGREAAEEALRLARGVSRADLEAEAESVLGELAYRSEDWSTASVSLGRQQVLWGAAGRPDREVDAAIRSSQLLARRESWEDAFKAANSALMLATRRRLPEQSAHAQNARGEALSGLERRDEALASFTEAQRLFGSLGESHRAHAAAAERRAQTLVQTGK